MDINDIIEMFNNNDLNVEKYFNDYRTFFKILNKRGLMDEIDPKNGVGSEHWQNEWMLWLYNDNRDKFNHWVKEFFNDIDFKDGQAILSLDDRGELSRVFYDSRRDGPSRKTIEEILSGDNSYEPYWNTTDDVYRDVIEELTPENNKRLYEYIIDVLKGQQISPETEELELIAEEQGHPEYVEVTPENVKRIVDDKESMWQLLHDQLHDLKGELYSVHSSAYNHAYENDVWDEIWNSLQKYFIGDGKWSTRPHPFKKDTTIETFEIPIKDFEDNVLTYLRDNKDYGNSGTLEYIGSYLGMLEESGDLLNPRFPDYPDSRKVDKNINEYFRDYI